MGFIQHVHHPTVSPPGRIVSGAERRLAVQYWLLVAAEDRDRARKQWQRDGHTLLRCGGVFSAIRISAHLIHAAAATDDVQAVDRFLLQALEGGPMFMDQVTRRYYVLVGSTTGLRNEWQRERDDAAFMGRGHHLAVPAVDATHPGAARRYWCVQMGSPGELADPDTVSHLLKLGRSRLTHAESALGG